MRAMKLGLAFAMVQCALAVDSSCNNAGWFPKPDEVTPCYPTLALLISEMNEPTIEITREEGYDGASENVTFELKLGRLPNSTEYLEDDEVFYVIDMKVLDSEISPQSDSQTGGCREVWGGRFQTPGVSTHHVASITRSYTQLSSDKCLLDAENAGNGLIEREGVIAIYVISTSIDANAPTQGRTGGEYVERTWLRYVTVTFNVTTMDNLGIHIGDIDFSDRFNRSFHLGGFQSSLTLYESTSFSTTRTNHSYEVGAAVHVDHSLDVSSPKLDLEVQAVYLSTEGTLNLPGDEDKVVHDMSNQLHEHDSDKSQVRFTFIARRCENCFLHVVSKVVHQFDGTRRLSGRQLQEDGYTMQTLYAEMRPRPVEDFHGPLVQLSMVIRGVDYSALVSSLSLRTRFIAELTGPIVKRMGNGIAEENIMVTLSPGSVKADIAITVPAGAELSAIKATIEAPSFQSTLEDDVTRSLVAVEGIYSVAHGTISSDLTAIEVTETEPLAERATSGLGPLEVALIVAAVACTVSVLACTLFLCRRARQAPRHKAGEGPKGVEGQPAASAEEATPGTSPDAAEVHV